MNSTVFGRIGKDAELRETNGGTQVANFSVALNVYNKPGDDKRTTWVNATIFGKQAESLTQYLTKGTAVALSGDLVLRRYEGRDGSGTRLDMAVNSVALLGGGQKPAAKSDSDEIPF
jgi:single-strand DNA-binding protein